MKLKGMLIQTANTFNSVIRFASSYQFQNCTSTQTTATVTPITVPTPPQIGVIT
jgi:hypothetical protein